MTDFSRWLILVYFFSMVSVVVTKYASAKLGNAIAVLGSIVAFTMAAFRPSSLPDYVEYALIYEQSSSGDFQNPEYWLIHGEPGFKILSYIISLSEFDHIGLMIFMSALSLALLVLTARISNIKFTYLWFTYFSIYFITRDLAQIRLAIALHLIAISTLQTSFYRKLILGALTSLTFQYFSFIAIAATFLSRMRPNIKIFLFLISASLIFGTLTTFQDIVPIIPARQLGAYEDSEHILPGHSMVLLPLVRNFILTMIAYFMVRKNLEIQKYRVWIWLAFLSTISYIAFGGILILAHRFAAYFGAIFPLIFACILNDKNTKSLNFFL